MGATDRYADLELIGEGVSARVYKAIDPTNGTVVAIKVLNPHLRADPISLERFRREIRITRFLNHPQIVSIYDLVTESDGTYLVMEYIEGGDLKKYLRLNAPLEIDAALAIVTQVLRILSACHARNVIHRDLKPQNIMVDENRLVRLLDFGIARMTSLGDLTQTGTSLGSPEYMAPELFAANTFDPRTDLYALGVIAFELLTGELPFRGDSLAVLYHQHLRAPLPRLDAHRPDAPAWLQDLLERLLAKQGYDRYQSADEVLADIERRQVVARELPALPRRECVRCGAETTAELPVCAFCGFNRFDAGKAGNWQLLTTDTQDRRKLNRYLKSALGVSLPPASRPTPLLVSGLDRFSAEIIKSSAQKHGIYLEAEQMTRARRARRPLVVLLLVPGLLSLAATFWAQAVLFSPWKAIANAFRFWSGPERWTWLISGGPETVTVIEIAAFGFLTWAAIGIYRKERRKPVLRSDQLVRRVDEAYGWLRDLVPFFASAASTSLKTHISQMVEKYLLVRKLGGDAGADVAGKLEDLLRTAAEVANAIAAMEPGLDPARLAQLSDRHAALERELEASPEPALVERREELGNEIAAACALEEKHSRLTNRLVHLQYVFNSLLGRLLVLQAPLQEPERELLEGAVRDLAGDIELSRAIHAELGALP